MATEVIVALITTAGLLLVALVSVQVELIRSRRSNTRDHEVVLTELKAVQGDVADVKADTQAVRAEQNRHSVRLATIEGRFDDHLLERSRLRGV